MSDQESAKGDDEGSSPYLGPITEAAFAKQPSGPPPIIREWEPCLTHVGNFALLWAGVVKTGESNLSWAWMSFNAGFPLPAQPDASVPAKVERMLAPLAHESRIAIMQALRESPLTATALSEATGLRGGNLYHHLRDLLNSYYVRDTAAGYALSDLGRQLLITLTAIAEQIIQDRDQEGLVVGERWS